MGSVSTPPRILYLGGLDENASQRLKLAGMRRYGAALGWDVVMVERPDSTPEKLPALFRRHRPVGCICEGSGHTVDLPPRLFGDVPVAYIEYPPAVVAGKAPNILVDDDAIARAAMHELSAGLPSGFAAVGYPRPWLWSRQRVRAFRRAVTESGRRCHVFPSVSVSKWETEEVFEARLVPWIARLPKRCALFVVNDETAAVVLRAARTAGRPVPRDLTLVSTDNIADFCAAADPPISSIQLDFERMGWLAASMLAARMTGRASREMEGRPAGEMKRDSFGGSAASSLRTECASSLPPPAAPSLPARRAPPLRRADGGRPAVVGPLLTVRRKSTSGRGRHEKFILEAVEMIRRESCDGLTARDLAARFPGSRRLFEMRFREAMGHSVLAEILHVRLEKAFTLLVGTATPIGAVPALCGFRCDRTLDALFRSRCGMSMRDWRRRNRG